MSAAPTLIKLLAISVDVLQGPNQGQKFKFEKGRVSIGRDPENDLVFAEDVKVSRQHLELLITPHEVLLRNLSQKNPISVDGEIVTDSILRPGASIRLGETELKIQFEAPIQLKAILALQPAAPLATIKNSNPIAVANSSATSSPALANSAFPPMPVQPNPGFPTQYQSSKSAHPTYRPPQTSGSRGPFYLIVGAIILAVAYFFTQEQIKKKADLRLRDSVSTQITINQSQTEYDKTVKEIEKKGLDTIQYRMAQEQYLRGFRDYRQGQYMRAMEGFQASLSFYPQHELARKYYTTSKRKFDEQIQFNMIQGKRYYGVNNYRLCMGFYATVIKMKKDERDPLRREALQFYNECEVKMRGKY